MAILGGGGGVEFLWESRNKILILILFFNIVSKKNRNSYYSAPNHSPI